MRWQGGPMKSGELGENGEYDKNSPIRLQDLPFSPLRTFLDISGLWL